MNKENIIISIAFFLIMVVFFYFKNASRLVTSKKKRKKAVDIIEVKYLFLINNIEKEKLLNKKMMLVFSVINAIIVDFVFVVVIVLKVPIFVKFIFGLILFMGLIYSIYGILGKILLKRGYGKK